MDILAHRGLWRISEERNSISSIRAALDAGFGIETDVRDYKGNLVISHDIADEKCISLEQVFMYYVEKGCGTELALNVKADGLQNKLISLIDRYHIQNYFLFDMSIPEMVVYQKMGMRYYTRESDVETSCVMYEDSVGVWLDSFFDEGWLNEKIINKHIERKRAVTIVSPELHGKEKEKVWAMIKYNGYHRSDLVKLCTDYPEEARGYFDD